jgi:hypothetical protein
MYFKMPWVPKINPTARRMRSVLRECVLTGCVGDAGDLQDIPEKRVLGDDHFSPRYLGAMESTTRSAKACSRDMIPFSGIGEMCCISYSHPSSSISSQAMLHLPGRLG